MNQNDPRYQLVLEQTRHFVQREFDMIPSVLFTELAGLREDDGYDATLRLVGDNSRKCCYCEEEVEQGQPIECNCDDDNCECELDPVEYDGKHHWVCEACGHNAVMTGEAYEDLELRGAVHAWPGAHGTCFWTTNEQAAEKAAECGFLVYEAQDFQGYVLAVDGGGYDFYEAHWVPLYLALGYTWHEREEGWQEACKKHVRQARHRLNAGD